MRLIRFPMGMLTVFAVNTTLVFVAMGDWRNAGGLSKARSQCEMRSRNGLVEGTPALPAEATYDSISSVLTPGNGYLRIDELLGVP